MLRIAATADLHGHLPEIDPADILCIAGDIFPAEYDENPSMQEEWFRDKFTLWIQKLPVRRIVLIGGNHDRFLEIRSGEFIKRYGSPDGRLVYLDGTSVTLNLPGGKVRIFGSPYCPLPVRHTAFCMEPALLADKFPPEELAAADIILTHTPPSGAGGPGTPAAEPWLDLGCRELEQGLRRAQDISSHTSAPDAGTTSPDSHPVLLLCGHIHQGSHETVRLGRFAITNVAFTDNDKMEAYPVRYF